MPGDYARTLHDIQVQGRWDRQLLSLMLYRNAMVVSPRDWPLNETLLGGNLASCHPAAIRFMNVVRPGLFPNDEVFGLADGKIDAAAQADVNLGVAAVNQNDQAIWVRYGGSNGHSFVLLTGHSNTVESFEAWAGEDGGYRFDQSVLDEPDRVGHPRADRSVVSTRAAIATALQDLLNPALPVRTAAVNLMSRAGVGGFGNNALGANVPGLNIHVAASQGLAGFAQTVRSRLQDVGYIRALTLYLSSQRNTYVCCHCQAAVLSRQAAQTARWRECTTCDRHYCRQCKHLLASQPRPTLVHTRVRICECTANTARI